MVNDTLTLFLNQFAAPVVRKEYLKLLQKHCGIDLAKVTFVGHHNAHFSTGYFGSGFGLTREPVLGFTLDGGGDSITSTVWYAKGVKIKPISKTTFETSLGYFYMYTTYYLGLKPVEDEYKLMGLAPYAPQHKVDKLLVKLQELIRVDRKSLTFKSSINTNIFYQYMPKLYKYERFDVIAAAVQQLTEQKIYEWIEAALSRYKANLLVTGGGVFSNVKVNQKILSNSKVKKAFFAPSPGDETNSLGACYWKFHQIFPKRIPKPITNLYLGPRASKEEINKSLKKAQKLGFKVTKPMNINDKIAKLLAKGGIVARFTGKLEFGARALGNRSILADASRLEVKDILNKMIKSRDFWMPFAPAILDTFKKKYLVNPKNIKSPFMMIAFDTTTEGVHDLAAAVHPYDKTARAQIVSQADNAEFWDLLKRFYKLTGKYGILNTSFNLHGEPIVCTPRDALNTLQRSGLKYLQIEDYLIEKNG
ncbi:MAG: carbamoyltransferase [Microgenomates group bacterium Gr01-1014_93]|nr:MAG: carbamoyltransferase [Microgenomates group bacterium Gr01-1014_93]